MSTYVFAIGGTGVRVLRSLTMLLASGCRGCSSSDEIVPIIIDYDRTNGDTKRTADLLENYQKIHEVAYDSRNSYREHFFCTPLPKMSDKIADRVDTPIVIDVQNDGTDKYSVDITDVPASETYAGYIGFNQLSEQNRTQETRELLTSLYDNSDKEDPCTELNLNLEKGFKGCPNIGCVVTGGLKDNVQIQNFLGLLNPETDRVIVIGSLFGGTGASGIPLIVDLIRTNQVDVPVGVLAVMPYFKIEARDGENKAIHSSTFEAKTKAALHAYQSSLNSKINVIYYIGDKVVQQGITYNEGGPGQKNRAHLVELISAMGIMHFTGLNINKGQIVAYEYGLEDDPANGDALKYFSFYQEKTRDLYLDYLSKLVFFNTFCKRYFLAGREAENDIWLINSGLKEKSEFKENLKVFIDAFDLWIKELETGDRQLKLYNVDNGYLGGLAWKSLVKERRLLSDLKAFSEEDIRTLLGQSYAKHKGEPSLLACPERMFLVNMYETMEKINKKVKQFNH